MKTLSMMAENFRSHCSPVRERVPPTTQAFTISFILVSVVICKVSLVPKPLSYGFLCPTPAKNGSKRKRMILLGPRKKILLIARTAEKWAIWTVMKTVCTHDLVGSILVKFSPHTA